MPAKRSEAEFLLERVPGFERAEGDHHRFTLMVNGRMVARTMTSHSHDTISDDVLSDIARQMHIRGAFLKELLARKKGRTHYLAELRRKDLLPPEDTV